MPQFIFFVFSLGLFLSVGIPSTRAVNEDFVVTELDGRDMPYYIKGWWHWYFSMDSGLRHPALDSTGDKCSLNQKGPVWYLVHHHDWDLYCRQIEAECFCP